MKKTLFQALLCLIFLCPFIGTALAQELRPGTITFKDGSEKSGQIKYYGWKNSPSSVIFQATDGTEQEYNPTEIAGFEVINDADIAERYRSHHINDSITITHVSYVGIKNSFLDVNVFLHTLVEGPGASLYAYHNNVETGSYYFVAPQDGPVEMLENKVERVMKDGDKYNKKKELYKNQLTYYMRDSEQARRKIPALKYTTNKLTELFEIYNQDFIARNVESVEGDKEFFKARKPKARVETGLAVGYNLALLNVVPSTKSSGSDLMTTLDYPMGGGIAAGLDFNIIFPRSNEKLSVALGIMYRQTKIKGERYSKYRSGDIRQYDADFNMSYIVVYLKPRYTFYTGSSIRPFIEAGVMGGGSGSAENILTVTSTDPEGEVTVSKKQFSTTQTLGYSLGTGISMPKFNVNLNMENSNGFGLGSGVETRLTTIYLMGVYKF